jgi:hypothetical protein
MSNFADDIQKFQRYGTYTYKFDSVGNLIFDNSSNDFSRVHLSLPLANSVYDGGKVAAFQSTVFEEFVTEVVGPSVNAEQLQQQLDVAKEENLTLKQQLDSMIAMSENDSTGAGDVATKQVILELRKSLGQGRVDSDFSEEFPYTPIKKEAKQ